MSLSRFIASRLANNKGEEKSTSSRMVSIGSWSMAIGVAIMIISIGIVNGYQEEIRQKVIGFGAHILIVNMEPMGGAQHPISIDQSFYPGLDSIEGVRHIQPFAVKPGIVRVNDQVHGITLKGVDGHYDWQFLQQYKVAGELPKFSDSLRSNQVVISQNIARKMKLAVGDKAFFYFVDQRVWPRKFEVAAIYHTSMGNFDESMVIGHLPHIQKLNGWEDDQIQGFEVILDDFDRIDQLDQQIYTSLGMDLTTIKITDQYQDIFGWLEYLNYNVVLILIIAFTVAAFNMITSLLILILDRTTMIGLLKAMGGSNQLIRQIFIHSAGRLVGRGIIWGNIIGLGLCWLQYQFGWLKLPQETYYLSEVPVSLHLWEIAALNLGVFLLSLLVMLLPSLVIAQFSPVKVLRYD